MKLYNQVKCWVPRSSVTIICSVLLDVFLSSQNNLIAHIFFFFFFFSEIKLGLNTVSPPTMNGVVWSQGIGRIT